MYEQAIRQPVKGTHENSWLIRRTVLNQVITVNAQWIAGLQIWGMACKVNGQLVDHRQADDPFCAAKDMVEEAVNAAEAVRDGEVQIMEGNGHEAVS